jgi:hypothetical protein
MHEQSVDEQISNIFSQIMSEIDSMADLRLRDLWMDAVNLFITTGDITSLELVTRWRRPVVDLDEFLFGQAFLGLREDETYPGVIQALRDLDTDEFDEVICKGGIGIGKTYFANLKTVRSLYKISCMRNPQQTYGIAQGSPIVITIQSVRLSTARKVVFGELGRFIKNSPYFQEKYRYNPLITSDMIFPEHNIRVMPVSSSSTAAISMNVIAGQMDEMNFMQKTLKSKSSQADEQGSFDQAIALYNNLASRRKSRFNKRFDLPGELFLISSSRFPDDFTEKKAKEAAMPPYNGNDPRIYVFEGSQWSVKGRHTFSDEEFRVQVGNETFPSKVLKSDEVPNRGCEIIIVPVDFHAEFVRDVDGAIRDIAGMTTLATRPFFSQRDKIGEAVNLAKEHGYVNPMELEQVEFSIGLPDLNRALVRTDVKTFRAAHIDLGVSRDACGIAVAHIAGHKIIEHKNEETGRSEMEVLPVIAYDVILRVVPPLGGEIQLDDVRKFLRKLNTKYKLNIEYVTFDGFQSTDSKQLLTKQGFKTGYLSVEKPEPWRTFRDALYDGRVLLTGHNYLNKELAEVETTVHNNKEKVDHRPNGTKDVADAVVGVAAFLFRRRIAWQQISLKGGRTGLFLLGDKTKISKLTDNVSTVNNDEPVRAKTNRRSIPRRSLRRR